MVLCTFSAAAVASDSERAVRSQAEQTLSPEAFPSPVETQFQEAAAFQAETLFLEGAPSQAVIQFQAEVPSQGEPPTPVGIRCQEGAAVPFPVETRCLVEAV